jgi:hypothetical protein
MNRLYPLPTAVLSTAVTTGFGKKELLHLKNYLAINIILTQCHRLPEQSCIMCGWTKD